jgi:hypothetical protein
MRFLTQTAVRSMLRRRYPAARPGCYFWDAFGELPSFQLSARTPFRRLAGVVESLVTTLDGAPPFVLFTDRHAGWRAVPKRRRRSPVSTQTLDEALVWVRARSRFRDGTTFADNYYLCDRSLDWFVVFCHHDDWHLWVTRGISRRRSFRTLARAARLRAEREE